MWSKNIALDMLANPNSKLSPINDGVSIELMFIPLVHDNVIN
jgi:hypothetical protein